MCEREGGDNRDLLGLLDTAADVLRAAGRLPLGGAVSDVALTQAVQKLEAVARVCAGQKAALVGELSRRQAHRGQAAGSTADLLARTLRLTPGQARAEEELAAGLALVPETAKALRDGRLGVEQARVTVRKAEEVKDRADAEALLSKIDATGATAGQELDRNRLAREIDTAVAKTGADVLAERERRAHERRSLTWDVRDGMTVLRAELDPVGGAQVRAVLDGLSVKTDAGDPRPFPQRQADALVLLATRAQDFTGELTAAGGPVADVLLITTRCSGRRRNRPSALQGTRPRLGLGHPEFALGGPGRRPRPPQASARARKAGTVVSSVRRGNRPRVLAMRQRAGRRPAGHSGVRTHGLGRSRRPESRDGTPRGGTCHTHIHQHHWQITKDPTGRYRAGPPPDLAAPHLDNSIAKTTRVLVHTG